MTTDAVAADADDDDDDNDADDDADADDDDDDMLFTRLLTSRCNVLSPRICYINVDVLDINTTVKFMRYTMFERLHKFSRLIDHQYEERCRLYRYKDSNNTRTYQTPTADTI